MSRALEQGSHGCRLGTTSRKVLEEMAEIYSLDLVLPTRAGEDIRLRTVGRIEPRLAIPLLELDPPLPKERKQTEEPWREQARMRKAPTRNQLHSQNCGRWVRVVSGPCGLG